MMPAMQMTTATPMGGMGMMPMPMIMPMGGMGMVPMMMPMGGTSTTPMMMPMMAKMTCEMTPDGMSCTLTPREGMSTEMFKTCCEAMTKMMSSGMPMMISCCGMPMMMCTA